MKKLNITTEKVIIVVYIFIVIVGIISSYNTTNKEETINTFYMLLSKKIILLDPGHGGKDPGKFLKDNILEKDINLSISKKLRTYLEQGGCFVLMTRADDTALDPKKSKDMLKRKTMIDQSKSDIFISIHQNSYHKEKIKGAQVFYFLNDDKSRLLAECIQRKLNIYLKAKIKRMAKPNKTYYLLKNSSIPSVIVECGFLTNKKERKLLLNENYQEKVSWAIYTGILDYFEILKEN